MNTFFSIWAGQMGRPCALLGRYVQLVNSELEVSDKLGGSYPLLLGADTVPEPFRNRSVVLASPNGSRTVPERSQNGPRTVPERFRPLTTGDRTYPFRPLTRMVSC